MRPSPASQTTPVPRRGSAASLAATTVLAMGLVGLTAAPRPAGAEDAAARHRGEVERFRAERLESLLTEDGWLTLVGLAWLHEGENTCGGAGADVVLPGDGVPARVGVFRLEAGKLRFDAAAAAAVTHGGKPVDRLELLTDADDGGPTRLERGSLSFYAIRRGDRVGVRIKDRESPARTSFAGLEYFPVSETWRITARFEPYDPPKPVPVPTVLGTTAEEPSPGALVFTVDGRTHRLDALPGGSQHEALFVVFGDATNGHETYGGGRFLDAELAADGTVVLDFNLAYNPPCIFTPFATCPLPPPQNRLPLRVEAGEKRYAGAPHH